MLQQTLKSVLFLNNDLHFDDVDKTSFDDCIFEKVSLKGNFIHVSFAGSKFSNVSLLEILHLLPVCLIIQMQLNILIII